MLRKRLLKRLHKLGYDTCTTCKSFSKVRMLDGFEYVCEKRISISARKEERKCPEYSLMSLKKLYILILAISPTKKLEHLYYSLDRET